MKKNLRKIFAPILIATLTICSSAVVNAADGDYVFLDEDLGSEQYGIGFRKDDTELCEKVNAALEALVEDGTYDKIGQKYPEIYDFLTLGK